MPVENEPTQAQLDAGFTFVRAQADAMGIIGRAAPDDKLRDFVKEFAEVLLNARAP
jgi:hypothetical protein